MAVYLSFIKRYFSDLPGYVFYVLYKLRININKYYTTCLARMALKFKGIQLGKNCVFLAGRFLYVFPDQQLRLVIIVRFDPTKYQIWWELTGDVLFPPTEKMRLS